MPLALVRSALAILGWVSVAFGPPKSTVERPDVVLWPASPEVADELPGSIDARFELQPRDALTTKLATARTDELARRQDEFAAVERALASAREHFVAQRFVEMEAELVALQRDHATLLADPAHCATLWEVEFRLGLAYQFRGQDGDRERMLARYLFAVELDGARRPARELYGPDVLAAFLEAIDARTGRVARPLTIDARPRDAVVHVDCKPVATGRVDLVPGYHVVHASAPGRAPQGIVVQSEGMSAVAMQPDVHTVDDPIASLGATVDDGAIDPKSTTARRALAAATTASGAEVTVLAWRRDGRAAARALVGAADGPIVVREGFADAIAAVLAGVDDHGKLRATPAVVVEPPTPPERKPKRCQWRCWTVIGSVAGTAVVAAIVLAIVFATPQPADRLVIVGPK